MIVDLDQFEREFILQVFSQTQIKVTDTNSVEVCTMIRTIMKKLKEEGSE